MGHDTLIVIPAFNEAANVASVLDGLVSAQLQADMLVIDDGSIDGTKQVVSSYRVGLIVHPCNLGYGTALQTGFKLASRQGYKYVAQFDADGQHSVADLALVLNELRTSSVDIVIGSRFLTGDNVPIGFAKRLAIRLFRWFIWRFTKSKITDPTSGLKAYRSSVFAHYADLNEYPADYPDADVIMDMLLKGWRVKEISIGHRDRTQGQSMHAGWRPIVYMVKVVLSIFVVIVNHQYERRRAKA